MTDDLQGNVNDEAIAEAQQQQERMLSQSEVNELVGTAKAEARRRAESEYQKRLEALEKERQGAQARNEDTTEIDTDSIVQQVSERIQQEQKSTQDFYEAQQIAESYLSKMSKGSENYEDFEDVIKKFDASAFPQIVRQVANMDNAADIMYELSKNPSKLATIDYLSHKSAELTRVALEKIGDSIANNRQALINEEQTQTPAPLDRMSPTNRSANNGRLSLQDLKSQPWLAG